MRIATVALLALAVSPAAAETAVSTSGECEVRFVRAPDDVRHVIESWLAAEPRCVSSIELRVVPTDDGYYLLAQRGDGRIHERIVPDATSAGVLVASWVADDWVEPPPPPAPIAPRPLIVNPFADQPERGITTNAPARRSAPRSFTVAAMLQAGSEHGGGGLRMELDLLGRGAWTLGVAVSASRSSYEVNPMTSYGTEDLKATAQLARTSTFGGWQLRLAAGAGVLSTKSELTEFTYGGPMYPGSYYGTENVTVVGEASISLSRRIGRNWAVTGGPVVSLMSQRLLTYDPGLWDPIVDAGAREVDVMFAGGLRYSL
jgi:hypothetical protein